MDWKNKALKNKNAVEILKLIKQNNKISRADLAKILNLTPASITKIVQKLIAEKFILEVGLNDSTGGRPPKILKLNNKLGNVISIYLSSDHIDLVLYDLDLNKIHSERHEILIRTQSIIIKTLKSMIENVIKNSKGKTLGIGIAVTGIVNAEKGISVYSPHYKWKDVNLKEILEEEFKINVFVENDVRSMALSEKNFGKAKKSKSFIVINIDNGVGSALYLNNQLYKGSSNGSGEFGHIPIEGNDKRCSCGKKGCLETLINDSALEEAYFEMTGDTKSSIEIYKDFHENPISNKLVKDVCVALAKGLVPIVNILNPDFIILEGNINIIKKDVYKLIIKELEKRTFGNLSENLVIESSTFAKESANKGIGSLTVEKIII